MKTKDGVHRRIHPSVCQTMLLLRILNVAMIALGAALVATNKDHAYTTMVFNGLFVVDINPVSGTYSAFCGVFVLDSPSLQNWFEMGFTGTNQTSVIRFAEDICVYGTTVSGSCNDHGRCNGRPRLFNDSGQETAGIVCIVLGNLPFMVVVVTWVTSWIKRPKADSTA